MKNNEAISRCRKTLSQAKNKLTQLSSRMIGPMEKGMEKAKLQSPPTGTYEGVDLSILPKFIAYKAALLREKVILCHVLFGLIVLFSVHYFTSRIELSNLYKNLREKEYILAPGVLDFTTASPQTVPDSYINDAASDFLADLGNFSSDNIEEQYASVKRFMSDELKVKFDLENKDWISQVKEDNISQILKVTEKEITTDDNGQFRVIALARADFYSNHQYLGHEDQVIEMRLELVPPKKGKRWYLQIDSLSWSKADTFRTKQQLSGDSQ